PAAGEHRRPGLLPRLAARAPRRHPPTSLRASAPADRCLPRYLPRVRRRLRHPRSRRLRRLPRRDRGAAGPGGPGRLAPQRLRAPLRLAARPPRPHRRGRDRARRFRPLPPRSTAARRADGLRDRARPRHGGPPAGSRDAAGIGEAETAPACPPKPSLPWPLSPRGREGKKKKCSTLFSLLSPWERRAGEVRASQGTTAPLLDPYCLDVHELADADLRQLAAVAGALDAAEGQARIGLDDAVDEDVAGV